MKINKSIYTISKKVYEWIENLNYNSTNTNIN